MKVSNLNYYDPHYFCKVCKTYLAEKITELWLTASYYMTAVLEQFIDSEIFKGRKIAPSYNRGKYSDISKYIYAPTFEEQHLKLTPFDGGVCLGSSFVFLDKYFETSDVKTTAKLFETGAPYEAVILQAHYAHLANESIYYKYLYSYLAELQGHYLKGETPTQVEAAFIALKAKYLNLDSGLNREAAAEIFDITKRYLDNSSSSSFADYFSTQFERRNKTLQYTIKLLSDYFRHGKHIYRHDLFDLGAIKIEKVYHTEATVTETLSNFSKWEKGAYLIFTSCANADGKVFGLHSLVLIKDDRGCTLFDSNFGTGYEEGSGLIERVLRHYAKESSGIYVFKMAPKAVSLERPQDTIS